MQSHPWIACHLLLAVPRSLLSSFFFFFSFFFFSSRRRHTRLQGDWSSDVCSSDLACPAATPMRNRHFNIDTTSARWCIQVRPSLGNSAALVRRRLQRDEIRGPAGFELRVSCTAPDLRRLKRSEERRGGKEWKCRCGWGHETNMS